MSLMWIISKKHQIARRNGWDMKTTETEMLCSKYGYSIEQNIDGEYVIYTGLFEGEEQS